jgi:Hydantoinase/oxoprolinase N-terminal region
MFTPRCVSRAARALFTPPPPQCDVAPPCYLCHSVALCVYVCVCVCVRKFVMFPDLTSRRLASLSAYPPMHSWRGFHPPPPPPPPPRTQLPDGCVRVVKLLSEDPENYSDAPREAIRRVLAEYQASSSSTATTAAAAPALVSTSQLEWIRMGTTVATNALLERNGECVLLLTTVGFADVLAIGREYGREREREIEREEREERERERERR